MKSITINIETINCFHKPNRSEEFNELLANGYTQSIGYWIAEKTITVPLSQRAISYDSAIATYNSLYARYGGQDLILNSGTRANILYRMLCKKCGFNVRQADWFDTTAKRGGSITGREYAL